MKKMIYAIVLISNISIASEVVNCFKDDNNSLWTESYSCDDGKERQIGHELINNYLVVKNNNDIKQHYQEKDNQLNMEYLKEMRKIKNNQ